MENLLLIEGRVTRGQKLAIAKIQKIHYLRSWCISPKNQSINQKIKMTGVNENMLPSLKILNF